MATVIHYTRSTWRWRCTLPSLARTCGSFRMVVMVPSSAIWPVNSRRAAWQSCAVIGRASEKQEDSSVKASVFVGTSLDGFIARPNGDLDFLPPGGGEPHGYDEFMATVDALVIGRKTFEKVLAFAAWPYGQKRVAVLSTRPVDFSTVRGGIVEQMAGPPAEIVSKLAASGAHHLYVDGGITIQ